MFFRVNFHIFLFLFRFFSFKKLMCYYFCGSHSHVYETIYLKLYCTRTSCLLTVSKAFLPLLLIFFFLIYIFFYCYNKLQRSSSPSAVVTYITNILFHCEKLGECFILKKLLQCRSECDEEEEEEEDNFVYSII